MTFLTNHCANWRYLHPYTACLGRSILSASQSLCICLHSTLRVLLSFMLFIRLGSLLLEALLGLFFFRNCRPPAAPIVAL